MLEDDRDNKSWPIRECERCGEKFNAKERGPGAKYCSACAPKAKKKRRREASKRRRKRKSQSPTPRVGDICSKCDYDVHLALQYSHEVNDFLCANCHSKLPGHGRKTFFSPNEQVQLFGQVYPRRIASSSVKGLEFDCDLCGHWYQVRVLEKHHVLPKSKGGTGASESLLALCSNCHEILHKKWEQWFETWYENSYEGRFQYESEKFWHLSAVNQVEVMERFHGWLSAEWRSIENRLKQGKTSLEDLV